MRLQAKRLPDAVYRRFRQLRVSLAIQQRQGRLRATLTALYSGLNLMLSKEMRSWIFNFQPAVEEIDLGKGYQTSCVRKKSWPRIWTRSNIFVILSKFGLSLATVGNSRTS